jgi:molybdopterin-binding protein
VRADGLLAQVRLRIGDQRLTAVITRDAVDELKLRAARRRSPSSSRPRS